MHAVALLAILIYWISSSSTRTF